MQYVDLLKLSSAMKQGKIKDARVYGVVVAETAPPRDAHNVAKDGNTFFARVLVFAAEFNRPKMRLNAIPASLWVIDRLQERHYLRGSMTVLLDRSKWYGKCAPIVLDGTIHRERGKVGTFFMAQWRRNIDNSWILGACAGSSPDEKQCSDIALQTEFMQCFDYAKKEMHWHEPVPASLQVCGIEPENPIVIKTNSEPVPPKEGDRGLDFSAAWGNLGLADGSAEEIPLNSALPPLETFTQVRFDTANTVVETQRMEASNLRKKQRDNRMEIRPKYEKLDELLDIANNSTSKCFSFTDSENYFNRDAHIDDAIKYMAAKLHLSWGKKPVRGLGHSGRSLFQMLLNHLIVTEAGVSAGDTINTLLEQFGTALPQIWSGEREVPNASESVVDALDRLYTCRYGAYFFIIKKILKLSCDLDSVYASLQDQFNMDLYQVLNKDPYVLGVLGLVNSMSDLDSLAMAFNTTNKDTLKTRNIVYLHLEMLDSNSDIISGSTCVLESLIARNLRFGYKVSKSDFVRMKETGVFFNDDTIVDIHEYISDSFTSDACKLPSYGSWKPLRTGGAFYELSSNITLAIQQYLDSGMGVRRELKHQRYLMDTYFFKQELDIYNRIYEISQNAKEYEDVDDEKIEEQIKMFESMKSEELGFDFKLEERQKDAIRLAVKAPVLAVTGPAGSGKTTVAEGIIFVAEALLGLEDSEIRFVAPTGKAADRLKECTKRNTSTMHSLFHVGVGDSSGFMASGREDMGLKFKVLVADESAMVDLELMHTSIMRAPEGVRIWFLGDVEQLAPIGFGAPFADMLRFLPCVVLNVSKRASESSMITCNAKEIIDNSDKPVLSELQSKKDCKLLQLPASDMKKVQEAISQLCMYHLGMSTVTPIAPITGLGDITPDDIQVITPIRKKTFKWGADQLNVVLQDVFNAKTSSKRCLQIVGHQTDEVTKEFREGDRVIHCKNIKDMVRFVDSSDGNYETLKESRGIMNGSVGKIVKIRPAKSIIVDDNPIVSDDDMTKIAIMVKYSDYIIEDDEPDGKRLDFYVMYICDSVEPLYDENSKLFRTTDYMTELDLAYALTVHKMQGSQAKLVIVVLFKVGTHSDFISRNMLYTAMTRAKSGLYLIGDVIGPDSAVAQARRIDATGKRNTLIANIIED